MSGGYTHITLAQLAIAEARNRREGLLHHNALQALGYWKKFCIVGAASPDYSYLDVLDSNSSAWADAMHKGHAVALLRNGVVRIRAMEDDNGRQKCMAWLFGFAAHVAADGAIHPVVNLKVGPYEQNKTEHRRCEMSQAVHAHRRLNLGVPDLNKQLSTNVNGTSDMDNPSRMDPDMALRSQDLLIGVYSGFEPQLQSPKVHDWRNAMRSMMKIAQSGHPLFHVAANQGLMHPAVPETHYRQGLKTPNDTMLNFEKIFKQALNNIVELWAWLALSLQSRGTWSNWSLNAGIDENNRMIYWS